MKKKYTKKQIFDAVMARKLEIIEQNRMCPGLIDGLDYFNLYYRFGEEEVEKTIKLVEKKLAKKQIPVKKNNPYGYYENFEGRLD